MVLKDANYKTIHSDKVKWPCVGLSSNGLERSQLINGLERHQSLDNSQ